MLAASLMCGSCLDKTPDYAIKSDEALTSVDAANQAVIGIYSSFMGAGLHSGYLSLLPDLQADLFYAINGYSNTFGDVWRWEIMPTNGEIEAVYGAQYGIINQCNFLLNHEAEIRAAIDNDDDVERMDQYCGEAYMARAIAYWELIRLFTKAYDKNTANQELGVVLNDEYDTQNTPRRATLQQSFDHLLNDISQAQKLLQLDKDQTAKTVSLCDYSYFTEYTAHALRARVALYMGDWDEAIKWSSKVIDSNFYVLSSPTSGYYASDDLAYLWQYDCGTEVIWKVEYTSTSYGYSTGAVFFNYDYSSYKPDYVPAQWVLNLYDSNDMRYDTYYQSLTTGHTHGLTWPLFTKLFGNLALAMSYNVLHTSMPKVFRLAEQYLIRAEAYAMKGNYVKAAQDITTLRRARYSSYGSSTSLSASNAMKVIEEERVKELIGEGFRLTDLKRWHKGFERTPQTESLKNGSSLKIDADNALFVWPIPQHEIEAPGAEIQPNESNK